MRKSLKKILIERDKITSEEADEIIRECKEDLLDRLNDGEDPTDSTFKGGGIENRIKIDKKIDRLVAKGHSNHCACRQALGGSQCVCDWPKEGEIINASITERKRRETK